MRSVAPDPLPAPSISRAAGYAKSADTRARILAAALEEASDAGLHSASLAGIAARAGVAIGNLHYHFGSREGLLRELMGSLVADLMSRLHAVDADNDADFFERERAGLLAYLDYLRANPAHVRLADEIKLHEPRLYRRAVGDWVRRIVARIRDGIAHGAVRPMKEAEITAQAYFMLGAGQFLDQMLEGTHDRSYPGDKAVVDAYVALLRHGLARNSGSSRTRAVTASRSSKTSGRTERIPSSRSKGKKPR